MTRWIAALVLSVLGGAAWADAPRPLGLELNTAETTGAACRLTFVLTNGTEADIDALLAEAVLFSRGGEVLLLTLFDFGALPAGRPRVRQFEVAGTPCDDLGQVLINGIATCEVGGTASGACAQALHVSSRIDIALEG